MTLEELQAALEASKKSVANLEAKNAELLAEKKKAAEKASETEDRLAKLEKDKADEKEKLEADAAKKAGDWDKREADLKAKHAAEMAAKDAELSKERAARDKLVLDNGLSSALDGAGVPAELKPAVLAMLRAQHKGAVEISADGDFVGKLGDKPIADFVGEWAKSDAAKPFISSNNNGGGAPGGKGGGKSADNPYLKESRNKTRQGQLEATDRALANKYRAEAGLPALA